MNIEELCDFYSSTNALLVIKSSRMRWVEHVTGVEEKINELFWGT
jgi:hypothetical protein